MNLPIETIVMYERVPLIMFASGNLSFAQALKRFINEEEILKSSLIEVFISFSVVNLCKSQD